MKRFINLFSIFLAGELIIIFIIALYFYLNINSVDDFLNGIALFLIIFTTLAFVFAIFLSSREERVYKYLKNVIDDLKESREPKFPQLNDRELIRIFSGIKEIYRTLKKNSIEIENEKDKLRFVINSMDDGVILLEKENIELINSAALDFLGIKDKSGNIIDLLSNHIFVDVFGEVLNKDRFEKEILIFSRWLLVKSISLNDKKLVIIRDITKQKNYAILKAKFFEDASHELKTPITSIMGYAETLLDDDIDEQLRKRFLEYIYQNAQNLSELVDDILTLHRLEKQKEPAKGSCNLADISEELNISFRSLAKEKGIDFIVNAEQKIVPIACSYLKSILWNLVDNAIKYTEKGHITVTCRCDNSHLILQVEDTGIGISPEHLPYIFDRFYTTQKSRNRRISGTGLGLAIVKHIVQLHNGSIDVKSKPSQGSVFTIKWSISDLGKCSTGSLNINQKLLSQKEK